MIIKQILYPLVIVGLPNVNPTESIVNKLDYTMQSNVCQTEKNKNTLEYNYITTKELLEQNHKKYQDLIR